MFLLSIQVLKNQFNSAQNKVSQLFKQLTTEATRLEKLKARYGAGGGSLQAFLQVGTAKVKMFWIKGGVFAVTHRKLPHYE